MCVGGQPALGDDYAADEALATRYKGDDCVAGEALTTRYNCTGNAWARCRKDEHDDGTETE